MMVAMSDDMVAMTNNAGPESWTIFVTVTSGHVGVGECRNPVNDRFSITTHGTPAKPFFFQWLSIRVVKVFAAAG